MAADYPTGRPTIDFPFAPIPFALLGDKEMGCTEVRVYGVLSWLAFEEGGGPLQPTQAEIAERMNCSERSVARPLAKLESAGWIERVIRQSGKGREADRYHLNSHRADLRTGAGAHHANLRGRDRADLRGPTTLKELRENTLTLTSEFPSPADTMPAVQSLDADFEEWYSGYPLKKSKGAARKAYRTARKKVDAETLIRGRDAFAKLMRSQQVDRAYIKHPSTWLNGECWDDELPQPHNPFQGPEMRFG